MKSRADPETSAIHSDLPGSAVGGASLRQEIKFENDLRRCVTSSVELLVSLTRTASVVVGGSFRGGGVYG